MSLERVKYFCPLQQYNEHDRNKQYCTTKSKIRINSNSKIKKTVCLLNEDSTKLLSQDLCQEVKLILSHLPYSVLTGAEFTFWF